jgi:RHS repeat-associated protein
VGNRSQVVDTTGTTTYGYDGLYRLTGVTYPNSDTQSYTYDAMGNRLTKVDNSVTTTYTYDNGGQMTAVDSTSYTYDGDGNTTAAGSDTYTWDAENRLAGTTIGGVTTTYGYNGAGLRTSQTTGGVTVNYAWDLTGSLPNILQDSAGNKYVYGLDLISKTNGTTQEYYLTDGLGSTTGITDGSGTVTGTYAYDAFGAVRAQTGATTEWSFTGEQHDATGLEYLRKRYYDPGTGRFLSMDPVPLLQRYAYVRANPANDVDPSGLAPQSSSADQSDVAVAKQILDDPCWKTRAFCNHSPLIWKVAFDPALRSSARNIGAVGFKGSACVPFCVSFTVGVVSDGVNPKGFFTLGFAGSTSVSADGQIEFTSGHSKNGYEGFSGWSYTGGVCGGEGWSGCVGTTNNRAYHSGSASFGVGLRAVPPVGINAGANYTWLFP